MSAVRGVGRSLFGTRRGRLVLLLLVTTLGITGLAVRAAGSSLSYYSTPEEFAQMIDTEGKRWRLGGRVVEGTIVEEGGRAIAFEIEGEGGERMAVAYDGIIPNLFGPNAFVVVEGTAEDSGLIRASTVVIKHENEFFADTPPEDSPSHKLLPTPTTN